jgi:hypothetical protein
MNDTETLDSVRAMVGRMVKTCPHCNGYGFINESVGNLDLGRVKCRECAKLRTILKSAGGLTWAT